MSLQSRFTYSVARILLTVVVSTVAVMVLAQAPTDLTIPRAQSVPVTDVPDSHSSTVLPAIAEPEAQALPQPSPLAGPLLERPKLTGDWFGTRSELAGHGITLDVSNTQFYQGVTSGGLEQEFRYGGRNDYFVNADCEKLGLWKGSFLTMHGETRYGQSANSLTGALMPVNLMLAVPQPNGSITALTGVKFTQFLSENSLVYAGKINTLDDFKQPLTGAGALTGFHNTAFMLNPVYARTVPYSTFGAGFAHLEDMEPVFAVSVFDTNNTPTVSGFDTLFDNGATIFAQVNLPTTYFDHPGHQGISGTYSSGTYTDLSPCAYLDPLEGLVIVSTPKTGSWCLAYNFDQALYVSPEAPKRKWGVFGTLGIADNNPSAINWFASAGISGASLIHTRQRDTFGIGYYYVGVSEPLKELAPRLLPLKDEQGVELYYNVAVTAWCQITPDLQVIAPFRERADASLLFGLRAKIDF
jgi:porin